MTPLAARLDRARIQTDALFDVLNPEALYQRPVAERHRLIFYLGHVEAFDWNLIGRGALNRPSFHPSFDKLFAFGIDPEPGRAPSDRPADWPSEKEVRAYGNRVRQELDEAAADVPEELLHVAVRTSAHARRNARLFVPQSALRFETRPCAGAVRRRFARQSNDGSSVRHRSARTAARRRIRLG